jgi:hypothetical protein
VCRNSCVSSSLGLALGSLFQQGDTALAIGPAVMVIYVIMGAVGPAGGASKSLPSVLAFVKTMSPIKWACEAMCAAEFAGKEFSSVLANKEFSSRDNEKGIVSSRPGGAKNSGVGPLKWISGLIGGVGMVLRHVLSGGGGGSRKADGTKKKAGDYVMDELGIQNTSVNKGFSVLFKMLAVHTVVAWIGLILGKPKL